MHAGRIWKSTWYLAILLISSTAGAQQNETTTLPPRVGVIGSTAITLQEVIAQALANNKDVEASRIDRLVARYTLMGAKGAFDPVIGFNSDYEKAVTPVSSLIGGSASGALTQKQLSAGPQFNGLIPRTGGSYRVGLTSRRVTTDNQFVTLNPQFPTALVFDVTQPLWRNLRTDPARSRIAIARKNEQLTDEQFRQRVIEVTVQAEKAYWDLVYAYRNFDVQREGVASAQQQVGSNRRMAKEGILAPIDVVEAETQLATLEQNLYTAQETLARAENGLKALILSDRNSMLWGTALVPEIPPINDIAIEPLPDLVNEAIARRPELAQNRINASINDINVKLYRNLTKSKVDFVASYTSAGLAGTLLPAGPNPLTGGTDALIARLNDLSVAQGLPPLPPLSAGGGGGVPGLLIGGLGQSFANLGGFAFPTARAGLQFSLPLRNRTAEADLGTAIAESRRTETRREAIELQIESDVRTSLQAVVSAQARLNAASNAKRSAEEQYASEQRKFQAGTSTVFLVLQRQSAMISARSGELRARAHRGKAIADFQRSTTRTLEAHNIGIDRVAGKP